MGRNESVKESVEQIRISEKEIELNPKLEHVRESGWDYRWEVRKHLRLRTQRQGWEICKDEQGENVTWGDPDDKSYQILLRKRSSQRSREKAEREARYESVIRSRTAIKTERIEE
jgi:hypothetical protein